MKPTDNEPEMASNKQGKQKNLRIEICKYKYKTRGSKYKYKTEGANTNEGGAAGKESSSSYIGAVAQWGAKLAQYHLPADAPDDDGGDYHLQIYYKIIVSNKVLRKEVKLILLLAALLTYCQACQKLLYGE